MMAKQIVLNPADNTETEIAFQSNDSGYEVTINGNTTQVEFDVTQTVRAGDRVSGRGVLRRENQVMPCYWMREGSRLDLWMNGQIVQLEIPDNTPQRGNAQGGGAVSGDIKSPMPGSILQVLVKEGDSVNAGDALIIMESMKMEMTLSAPADGVVKAISCKSGELTELNQLLIAIELADDDA